MPQCPKCNINAFHNNLCNRCGYVGKKKQSNILASKKSFSKFYIIIPAVVLVIFFIFTDKGKMLFFNYYNEMVNSNNITADKKSIFEKKENKSSSNSNSTNMNMDEALEYACNGGLRFLKGIGFNFSSYQTSSPFTIAGIISCGITNTGNSIHIYTSPKQRLFVFDEFSTIEGYCVQMNGKYEKTTANTCY